MVDLMSRSSLAQRCCVAYTPKCLKGRTKRRHTDHDRCGLLVFSLFSSEQREETASITYQSSLAVSQNRFIFFSFPVKIYSSPHSSQDDVLSDSYSCVTEHAPWKVRARSVIKSSLALLKHYEGKCLHNPRCNANVRVHVHVQLCNLSGAQGASRARSVIS